RHAVRVSAGRCAKAAKLLLPLRVTGSVGLDEPAYAYSILWRSRQRQENIAAIRRGLHILRRQVRLDGVDDVLVDPYECASRGRSWRWGRCRCRRDPPLAAPSCVVAWLRRSRCQRDCHSRLLWKRGKRANAQTQGYCQQAAVRHACRGPPTIDTSRSEPLHPG